MTEAEKELLDRCNERDDLLTVFNRLKDSKLDKLLEQTQLVGDVIKNVNQWMALVDKLQDLDQRRFDEAQGIVDAVGKEIDAVIKELKDQAKKETQGVLNGIEALVDKIQKEAKEQEARLAAIQDKIAGLPPNDD